MSKPSILPFVLVVTIPIGLFLAAVAVIVVLSAVVWDTVQTESFMSQLSMPFGETFKNMRQMRIKNQAIPLVAVLNEMGPTGGSQAEDTLVRLIVLSGEDFGTGFKGDRHKHTWKKPETPEEWSDVMNRVNSWSDDNFGTDFGPTPGQFSPPGANEEGSSGEYVFPEEPPPTYELPEEREAPSYTPPPTYEPPPPPEYHDTGGELSPDYNSNDGFQPGD